MKNLESTPEQLYKTGKVVTINVKGDIRSATIVEDGLDSKNRVRVRPSRFPMDISVEKECVMDLD